MAQSDDNRHREEQERRERELKEEEERRKRKAKEDEHERYSPGTQGGGPRKQAGSE
jgi:hypothetical protein